jgi:PPE-repeat protein
MIGFKATNADLTCQGFKFEIGKWHEIDGEIELCKRGFHFCVHASGPYAHYSQSDARVFKVEAEQVLKVPTEAGADFKLVARRIRLVSEITPGGDGNTGDRNTGDGNTADGNTGNRNTGDRNTGNWNTGNWNTADGNTGDRNTGNWNTGNWNTGNRNTGYGNTGNRNIGDGNTGDGNTGDGNTGDRNTGDRNTGYGNTGNWNTGNRNTGDGNTGDRNTGNWNTGNGNTGNRNTGYGNSASYCTGFFCSKDPRVLSFDVQTKLTHAEFLENHPEANTLSELLLKPELIEFAPFKRIPGITKSKLAKLHAAHLKARAA